MAKASELIGRDVVIREGGVNAGKVKDVVVDPSGRQVLGFVVAEGLLKGTRVAPWPSIQAIGPDAVILGAADAVVKADEAPDIKAVLDKNLKVHGLRLQTTAGKDLGKIEDFTFDEGSGAVLGYQLSGGMLADAFGGRSFMPTPTSLEIGADLAFVGPEVEATIQKA